MSVGTYSREDILQAWFISKLPKARETLSTFHRLNELLEGFNNYENKLYRKVRNSVMFLCLPRVGNGYNNQISFLEQLEKALEIFNVDKWSKIKYQAFKARIASEKFDVSYSAQTELEVAFELVKELGKKNVALYPELQHGRYSDVLVTLEGRRIYIEIGNLSESLPERKVNRILRESAAHLGKQLDRDYMQIIVDTAEFVFSDKGVLDEVASVQKLNLEIDRLKLNKLVGYEGFFDIKDILWIIQNKSLFEENARYVGDLGNLSRLYENTAIKNWLNDIEFEAIEKARLVKGIMAGHLEGKLSLLVEIHTEGIYPSKTSFAEIQSVINHIIRNAKEQLIEKQIEPNSANIIAVRAHNFLLFSVLFSEMAKLENSMHKFFHEVDNKDLSGLVIFRDSFRTVIFFKNPQASPASLLNDNEIVKLGLRLPTNDFDF
jgi:hypothetical protein